MESIYDITVKKPNGESQSMADYKGKSLLIVNTASKCGFVGQFEELEALYKKYKDQGLEVIGFPSDNFGNQEFEDEDETMSFCKVNYGVTFPMFAKVDVKGDQADPLFKFLAKEQKGMFTEGVKWNFTKFLVDREGQVVARVAPQSSPLKMVKSIEKILKE